MGIFDWFKKRGSGEEPSGSSYDGSNGDSNDPVVWLRRKVTEHRVPADIAALGAVELFNPVTHLAEAAAGFRRGPLGWAFGMTLGGIDPSALETLRDEAGEALNAWERALEAAHGEMGLSLFAEAVDGRGVPHRGELRHPLRRGTLDPTEPRIEELASALDTDIPVTIDPVDGGVAVRVDGGDFGAGAQAALDLALAERGAELVTLTLGLFEEGDYSEVWDLLRRHGPLPKLREFYVDFEYPEEVEISWTRLGKVDPLWKAAPELRDLRLRGGEIRLAKPRHPKLEKLVVESGGLPRKTVRALCSAVAAGAFPMLKTLSLWAGTPEYGGEARVEDFAALWCDTPPSALTHLGLMNTVLSDELVEPLVAAPLARQLVELSFGLGTLTDVGARALIAGRSSFAALEELDVSDCFLTPDAIADLERAFGSVQVTSVGQEEPDGFDDEVYTYVSVSE